MERPAPKQEQLCVSTRRSSGLTLPVNCAHRFAANIASALQGHKVGRKACSNRCLSRLPTGQITPTADGCGR